jgi:hypothetical protein
MTDVTPFKYSRQVQILRRSGIICGSALGRFCRRFLMQMFGGDSLI